MKPEPNNVRFPTIPISSDSYGFAPASVRTTSRIAASAAAFARRRASTARPDIAGDRNAPVRTSGRLCVKASALGETVGLDGRLLQPKRATRTPGALRGAWNDADRRGGGRLSAASSTQHGPDAVALYVSGQLLTEDYYVANKLMKGYIGTANIDTNSRLCMSSAVAGHKRAFGEDLVPVNYEDLEQADLVVLVGSNTAWCHPILFQRIAKAKEARPEMKVVVIDPRRTATCELADLHLPLRAGTDVWLFNGLLAFLHQHGATDAGFRRPHTPAALRPHAGDRRKHRRRRTLGSAAPARCRRSDLLRVLSAVRAHRAA